LLSLVTVAGEEQYVVNGHAPVKAIALPRTPSAVVQAAVDVVRDALGSDVAFAAVGSDAAGFPITSARGMRDPRWSDIVVRRTPDSAAKWKRLSLGGGTLAADPSPKPRRDTPMPGTGTGIRTLRTRAERLGGSLWLVAGPAGRAVLQLVFPYDELVV
jgi:hypothetical protein